MSPPAAALDPVAASSLRRWRVRVFLATWLCYAGFYFCRKPFYIVKKPLGDALHFDTATLGNVGAAYLICYAAGQYLAGTLGDRLGPRRVLLAGAATSIACSVGFGLAGSASAFYLLMAINGLAQATGWSNCIGSMASWFHRGERGRVMGVWATNFQVGGVAANALASFVLARSDWRGALFSGAGVLVAVWLVVAAWQRNRPEDVGLPPVEDPAAAGGDGSTAAAPPVEERHAPLPRSAWANIALIGTFYFFAKFIRYALWSWAPYFFSQTFGRPLDEAGYLSTLFDVFGIPGVIITGYLSDKLFGARRAGISFLLLAVMTGTTLFLYLVGSRSVPVFAASICVIGFTLYGPDALLTGAAAMDIGSKRHATLAASRISFLGSLGSVVQELVIGHVYDARTGDLGTVFLLLFGSAVMCTAAIGVVLVRNRLGRSQV